MLRNGCEFERLKCRDDDEGERGDMVAKDQLNASKKGDICSLSSVTVTLCV